MKQRLSVALGRAPEEQERSFGEGRIADPLTLPAPFCAKHALDAEYSRICRNPIDGIYVVPSGNDAYRWYGAVFIRAGVFSGGIFRFTISIQKDYPCTTLLPQIVFDVSIFHPHIDKNTHVLELTRYFPDGWKKDKHHIQYALIVAQRIFFSLDANHESCANPEAARLWRDDRRKFKEIAKDCVNESRSHVYDDPPSEDPNSISFTPWDSSVHENTRHLMKNILSPKAEPAGISWFDVDRMTCMVEPLQRHSDVPPKDGLGDRPVPIERLDFSEITDQTPAPAPTNNNSFWASYSREDIEISDV